DLWIKMRCDTERKSHVHARTVTLHRRVEEFSDLAELDDVVKLLSNLRAAHAENRAVEKNVFSPCQLGMKTSPHFEQRTHATVHNPLPRRRCGDSAGYLEHRRFTRPASPDDSDRFALFDLETDIFERPGCVGLVEILTQAFEARKWRTGGVR